MNVIEITAFKDGAHHNVQDINYIPEGYAQIPDDMSIPETFPFVNIEVGDETRYIEKRVYNEETEEYDTEQIPCTVKVVTKMTEGVVPPYEQEDDELESLTVEQMAKAITEGVNSI